MFYVRLDVVLGGFFVVVGRIDCAKQNNCAKKGRISHKSMETLSLIMFKDIQFRTRVMISLSKEIKKGTIRIKSGGVTVEKSIFITRMAYGCR